jgi:acyl dehydratase
VTSVALAPVLSQQGRVRLADWPGAKRNRVGSPMGEHRSGPDEGVAVSYFSMEDQKAFAALSGDYNPMHMDQLASRRTPAGRPVAHGMHLLLRTLEYAADAGLPLTTLAQLEVHFGKFAYLGRPLTVRLVSADAATARIELLDDELVTMAVLLRFGPRTLGERYESRPEVKISALPSELSLEQMIGRKGWLAPLVDPSDITRRFPNASAAVGARRLSGLIQLSRLVGMVCPGLHSIFTGLNITLIDGPNVDRGIGFDVADVDDRYGRVEMNVEGEGLTGVVTAFSRQAPVGTPPMADLTRLVRPGEFGGATAFVAGGSRGLGALTAKLIAAGGGRVIVTYAQGFEDAEHLRQEINTACGEDVCVIMKFDATRPVREQLAGLQTQVSHLFYYATPQIYVQRSRLFMPDVFASFTRYYVDAFYELCVSLYSGKLSVFYPSSVFVSEVPREFLEYSMAKQAGEMLCKSMPGSMPGLDILMDRIPRTLTDQTATLALVDNADPLDIMLPRVRATYALGRCLP